MKSQKSKTDIHFPLCKKEKQEKKKKKGGGLPGQVVKKSAHVSEKTAPEPDQFQELEAKGTHLRLLKEAEDFIQMKKKNHVSFMNIGMMIRILW